MSRPSFEDIYLGMAKALAKRSTCSRLQVGTVITSADHRHVFAVGYNGNATGLPNKCDTEEAGACGCLHSESNAIVNCNAPRSERKRVYVTHNPCPMCAKMLINLGGIVEVNYLTAYRSAVGIDLLTAAAIPTHLRTLIEEPMLLHLIHKHVLIPTIDRTYEGKLLEVDSLFVQMRLRTGKVVGIPTSSINGPVHEIPTSGE